KRFFFVFELIGLNGDVVVVKLLFDANLPATDNFCSGFFNDKLPINNKNYELILVPTTDNTKTVVVPSGGTNEKTVLPPPTT
ncbi:unnamed protein product, partial [Rotaria sp. Silwood1]